MKEQKKIDDEKSILDAKAQKLKEEAEQKFKIEEAKRIMEENKLKREAEEAAKKKAVLGSKPAFGKPKNMFGSKPAMGGDGIKPKEESAYTPSVMSNNPTPNTKSVSALNQPSTEKKYPWAQDNKPSG